MDLKKTMMMLGNALVQKHRYDPPAPTRRLSGRPADKSTTAIQALTDFLNGSPEAREELAKMGIEWPMPEQRGQ